MQHHLTACATACQRISTQTDQLLHRASQEVGCETAHFEGGFEAPLVQEDEGYTAQLVALAGFSRAVPAPGRSEEGVPAFKLLFLLLRGWNPEGWVTVCSIFTLPPLHGVV